MSHSLGDEEKKILESEEMVSKYVKEISGKDDLSKVTLFKGKGCKACGDTGYSGRTGIFEVIEITEELRSLITKKSSSDIIEKKARELGSTSMLHDGVRKIFQGVTTLQEVLRVTKT